MADKDEKSILWLRLARTPGVGPVTGIKLLEAMGSLENIFQASSADLKAVSGIRKDAAAMLGDESVLEEARKEFEACRKAGVAITGIDDPEYPEGLRHIADPPLFMYIKGELPETEDFIAMVGCRNPDPYGESMAASLAAGLARYNITVVSGMARGIDGIAQRSALKADGPTVAVLGTGVDVPYPPENKDLYESILDKGAVVSEFPLGTGPTAGNFPRRNRIVSGLSKGVVMVQAMSERSGALITVRHALEQDREVYAVPGNAGSRGGRVGNSLIKQGARLVETAEDVLCDFLPVGSLLEEEEGQDKKDEVVKRLPDLQARIYSLVPWPNEGTADVDALARQAGIPSQEAVSVLLDLELGGLIKPLPGKRYVRLSRS